MKKIQMVVVMVLMVVLAGCGNTQEGNGKAKKVAQGDTAEVTIKEGQFVKLVGSGVDEDQDVIGLEVNVKNTSKEKMYLFEETFYLVEKNKDEKIKALVLDYENGGQMSWGELAANKSMTEMVYFPVEADKKYEFIFSSGGYTEDGRMYADIEQTLDLKKYAETKNQLDTPAKALQAYIDVVFLQKNNDDYEKLVANDAKTDVEMVTKEFSNLMKDTFYNYRLTDKELATAFESYVGNQSEAVETKVTTISNLGDRAVTEVEFTGISEQAASDLISEYKEEYYDKNDDYDSKASEKYALSKIENVYSEAETGEPREDINVTLTKKDDKWLVDFKNSDFYANEYLLKAFLGRVD